MLPEQLSLPMGEPGVSSSFLHQAFHLDSLMMPASTAVCAATAAVDVAPGATPTVSTVGDDELIGEVTCSVYDARMDGGMLSDRPQDACSALDAPSASADMQQQEVGSTEDHFRELEIVHGMELMEFHGDLLGISADGGIESVPLTVDDAEAQLAAGYHSAAESRQEPNSSAGGNDGCPRSSDAIEQIKLVGIAGEECGKANTPMLIVLDDNGDVVDGSDGVPVDAVTSPATPMSSGSDDMFGGPMSPGTPQGTLSSPETPTGSGKKRKGAPRAKRTQRCGECHTCKNPKLKRACENKVVEILSPDAALTNPNPPTAKSDSTVAPEPLQSTNTVSHETPPPSVQVGTVEAAAKQASHSPESAKPAKKNVSSRYAKVALQSSANQPAPSQAARPRPEARDMTAVLAPLLSPAGGVEDVEKFKRFQELFAKEDTLQMRFLLLAIMELTTHKGCLKQFVADSGLVTLNVWLSEARDTGVSLANEGRHTESQGMFSFSNKIIATLQRLPVTLDSLSKSQIGKTVRSIVKTPAGNDVKGAAKALVNTWKSMFIKPPQTAAPAGEKRDRTKEETASQSVKKVIPEKPTASEKPGGEEKAGMSTSTGLALQAADDDLLFQSRKTAPRLKPAPLVIRRKVQRLETPSGDGSTAAADAAVSPKGTSSSPTGGPKPVDDTSSDMPDSDMPDIEAGEIVEEAGQEGNCKPAAETQSEGSEGETAVVEPPKQTARLPVTIKVTNINPYQRVSAAQRAAEAAARIPDDIYASESSAGRKVKSKKVSFKTDNERAVRIFRKDMPPQNACKDDIDVEEEDAAVVPTSPRLAFESAAKREHMWERETNEHAHESPSEPDMGPLIDWTPPRDILLGAEDAAVANGEGSVEAGVQSEREDKNMPSLYSTGLSRTYSPIEPGLLSRKEREDQQKRPTVIPWTVTPTPLPVASSVPPIATTQTQAPPQPQVSAPAPAATESPGASLMDFVSQLDPSLVSHLQSMSHQVPLQANQTPPTTQPIWHAPPQPQHAPQPAWEQQGQTLGAGPSYAPSGHYPPTTFPPVSGGWGAAPMGGPPVPPPRPAFDNGGAHDSFPQHSGRPGSYMGQRMPLSPDGGAPPVGSSWRSLANEIDRSRAGSPPPRRYSPPGGGSGRRSAAWDGAPPFGGRGDRGPSGWEQRQAGMSWRDLRDMPERDSHNNSGPPLTRGSGGPPPAAAASAKPCLFFNTPKGCRNGASCKFAHVETGMRQNDLIAHITAISKRPAPPETNFQPMNRRRLD